jgi:hypothetical protein
MESEILMGRLISSTQKVVVHHYPDKRLETSLTGFGWDVDAALNWNLP